MPHQILLIDDSATVQQLIRLAVADEGIEVIDASTLASARKHLQNREPDLILVKISLPDGDGYTFCREVKTSTPTIPVLLLASVQDPLDAIRAQAVGANGALTKPFQSISALLETVKNLIKTSASPVRPEASIAEDVLELDDLLFVPPMNTSTSTPAAPGSIPLTETQIEQLAERVALIIEDRLRRSLLADVVARATPDDLRRVDEKSAPAESNPAPDIDVA